MTSTMDPTSPEDITTATTTPFPTPDNQNSSSSTESPLIDLHAYLELQNQQFVVDLVPTLVYSGGLMLLGLVGNSLVLAVYYRRFKPSVTRTYILAMSVCDLLTNLLSLPADVVEVRFHHTFQDRGLCKSFRTVKSILGFLSAYILVAVAFDRQRAICSPQSNPTTVRHAMVVVAVVSVLAVVFTVPYSILVGSKTVDIEGSNITGLECSVDDVYAKSLFLFIYNMVTGLVLIICITLMLGSYVRIAIHLCQHKKLTSTMMGAVSGGRRGTKSSEGTGHTYTFEESSSDRTHSSSVKDHGSSDRTQGSSDKNQGSSDRTQCSPHKMLSSSEEIQSSSSKFTDIVARADESLQAQNSTTPADIELVQISPKPNEKLSDDLHTETQTDNAEKSNRACPIASKTEQAFETMDSCSKASKQPMPTMETRDLGNEGTILPKQEKTFSEDKAHAKNRKVSNHNHKPLHSSSVLSRIRQTASSARSLMTRRKSASKPRRGSVKKIPTRTTFMMFVLTVMFIVNYLPYLLLVSLRSRVGMEPLVATLGLNGYAIGLRSYFINSAVNPLVYSFCSARFRQECRLLLNCRRH